MLKVRVKVQNSTLEAHLKITYPSETVKTIYLSNYEISKSIIDYQFE